MGNLAVTVKPNARTARIVVADGIVEVRVTAPPRDGAANEAVRRAIADALGVPLRAVTLTRGASAKHKAFAIEGIETAVALERLARGGDVRHPS